MGTTSTVKRITYDLTATDRVAGPMDRAARSVDKVAERMDFASRNARVLDRALDSQRKAADAAAGASLALAKADKILGDVELELAGKAEIADKALKNQGNAARNAARDAKDAKGGFTGLVGSITGFGDASGVASSKGSMFSRVLAGLNLATGVAEPAMAGLVVAGGSLAAAYASAGAGLGVFGAVAKSVLSQASSAAQKYTAAQQKLNLATTSKQRTAALAAEKAALYGLDSAQKQVVFSIIGAQGQWQKFTRTATPGVARVLAQAVRLLPSAFALMRPFLAPVEKALSGIIGSMRSGIGPGSTFSKIMRDFAANSGTSLSLALRTAGHLLLGLLGVLHAFLPEGGHLLTWVEQASEKFQKWGTTLSSHTGFQSLMTTFRTETPQAVKILQNLGTVLLNVGKSMTGLSTFANSRSLLQALLPLSGLLASLSRNQALTRIALYLLAATAAANKLKPAFLGVKAAVAFFPNLWKDVVKFAAVTEGATTAEVVAAAATRAWGVAMKALPWVALAAAVIAAALLIIKYHKQIWAFAQRVWHDVLAVIMGVWHWVQRNWPLLLGIITGPVGLAVLWVVRHFPAITSAVRTVLGNVRSAWNATWNTLRAAFRTLVVNGILTPLGWIVHAAASAFGWVPGLGGKLRGAARAFDQFRANVNRALGGINGRTVNVGVAMTSSTNPYPGGISGRKAQGGRITGPGGPRDDRAGLYALSNGEWVIRAAAAAKYGPAAMDAVNRGMAVIGYADGGGVNVRTRTPGYGAIESSLLGSVLKLAKAFASAASVVTAIPVRNLGSGIARWAPLVSQALAMERLNPNLVLAVLYQMLTESGGNPNAINLTDINAQRGDPSRGLMQVIGSTFRAYHWPGTSWNIYDPLANIAAALNYARHVYGPSLMSHGMGIGSGHGYAQGTRSARRGWAWAGEGGVPELIHFSGGEQVGPVLRPRRGGTVVIHNHYSITVKVPPTASKADTGRAVVECIGAYEQANGKKWRS